MGDELLKTVIWVGASKKELLEFPEDVIDEVGYILYRVQKNQTHPHIKPLKGLRGVFEIVSDYKTDTYRTVYAIKLGNAVYVLHAFKKKYDYYNRKHGLNQPLIPYFISSHPGSEMEDMANLAAETKDMGFRLEQVQDFTPTPMTVATIIYYTGLHPYTLRPVYTARSKFAGGGENGYL